MLLNKRFWLQLVTLWLVCVTTAWASEALNLRVQQLQFRGVQLQDLHFEVNQLNQTQQGLKLAAEQLVLPEPFKKLQLAQLQCAKFYWQADELTCQNGQIEIQGISAQPLRSHFNFSLRPNDSQWNFEKLKFAGGWIKLNALESQGEWNITLHAENISLAKLHSLISESQVHFKQGKLSAELSLQGRASTIAELHFKMHTQDATIDSGSGQWATEKLHFDSYITAQNTGQQWAWQMHNQLQQGGLYLDPIYLNRPERDIACDGVGQWVPADNRWKIDYLQWLHPQVGTLQALGLLEPKHSPVLTQAKLQLQVRDLAVAGQTYLQPWLLGSNYAGLALTGQLYSQLSLQNAKLQALQISTEHLDLTDPKQRWAIHNVQLDLNWSEQQTQPRLGHLRWDKLELYQIPLAATHLDLLLSAKQVRLRHPVKIPVLGGQFAIADFQWQQRGNQEPLVHFVGALEGISLDQLTTQLHWTPLTGKISGAIPGVRYQNNRLDLDGALSIQVFGGKITLAKLAVANLLSPLPKFYSDILIENLNLSQLTEKFQFGGIEGLLSGYINDLYMENWQPISFYAWLGTPEQDESRHRISQKAVDNIANIGGNGATDLISKSIMGIFDAFSYDKLGMGCYLHHGVCQLMGVSAAPNGYYLIKGGGIPRIDVIGFNPSVDWHILVERLGRLSMKNNMVIE